MVCLQYGMCGVCVLYVCVVYDCKGCVCGLYVVFVHALCVWYCVCVVCVVDGCVSVCVACGVCVYVLFEFCICVVCV